MAYTGMRTLPAVAAVLCVLTACGPDKQHYVPDVEGGDITPVMATADVNTLISDSGYTRYRVVTPLWLMFEDAEDPFWRFPDGIELEQYDHAMQPVSNVVCDSATYMSRQRIWRLDGNVVMVNTERDSFLTQLLFWDQTNRKIYTDSFIHIVRSDRTIEGYGFESDQNMLWYTVHRPTAILPASSMPGSRRNIDSTATASDSMPASTPVKPAPRASSRPSNAADDEAHATSTITIRSGDSLGKHEIKRQRLTPIKRK